MPSAGATAHEAAQDRPARERVPEARRGDRHRDRGEQGEAPRARPVPRRGRGSRPAAARRPRPSRPCRARGRCRRPAAASARALARGVVVLPCGRVRVLVSVEVAMDRRRRARGVGVEIAAPPPQQQSYRERHDHDPDGDLRCLLDRVREVAVEQHDRQAEGDQGGRVAEPPAEAQASRRRAALLLAGGDQRRDRRRGGRGRSHAAARAAIATAITIRNASPVPSAAILSSRPNINPVLTAATETRGPL